MSLNTYSLDLERDSEQGAYCADNAEVSLTGDLTFEFWVKFESLPTSSVMNFLHKWESASGYSYLFRLKIEANDDQTLQFYLSDTGTSASYEALTKVLSSKFVTGTWYHIAITWDASTSTMEFFIDGGSIGTATGSITAIHDNATPFYVGSQTTPANCLDAKIDDLRLWSDIRTDSEILDNKDLELVGNEANLNSYWKFNNDYTDETSAGNDLTAVNNPVFSEDVPFVGAAPGPTGVKTINDLAVGSVKSINDCLIASVKTINDAS